MDTTFTTKDDHNVAVWDFEESNAASGGLFYSSRNGRTVAHIPREELERFSKWLTDFLKPKPPTAVGSTVLYKGRLHALTASGEWVNLEAPGFDDSARNVSTLDGPFEVKFDAGKGK